VVHWSMDIEFPEDVDFPLRTRFEMTLRRLAPAGR
jgi:hypothetical protein